MGEGGLFGVGNKHGREKQWDTSHNCRIQGLTLFKLLVLIRFQTRSLPHNTFMNRFNSLRSPRSKPISQYTLQLHYLLSQPMPPTLKSKLLQGLLQEIKYKIQCLKTPKLKTQLAHQLQQQLMWTQIERMERCIIRKRIEKEEFENSICECQDQIVNIEEVWELKKEIKEELDKEIEMLGGKRREMSEGDTLVSLGEVDGREKKKNVEIGRVSIGTVSVQSQNSYPALD